MTETNRYGQPLKEATLEEIIKDLEALPGEVVLTLCAALVKVHLSKMWKEVFKAMTNDSEANDYE